MATAHHGYWTAAEKRTWTLVLFLGVVVLYANRVCLPVTIVEIAEELQWDKRDCGVVLSSFYWGYVLFQVAGGWLADRHGSERVLWVAGVLWSLAGLSIAYLAYVSIYAVLLARFVAGLSQGVNYPALVSLMTKKVNPKERSLYIGFVGTGLAYGPIIVSSCTFLLNWPVMYVLFGVLGLMWALLLRDVSRRFGDSVEKRKENGPSTGPVRFGSVFTSVPWRQIVCKPVVLAVFLTYFCDRFLVHNVLSWSPTYFHDTFPSHRGSIWLSNSLPWLAIALAGPVGGWTVHRLADTYGLGMSYARKVIVCVCLGTEALCFLAIAASNQNDTTLNFVMANFFLTVASFGHGVMIVGPTMTLTDIVPEHVGAVYGVMNTIGALPGILGVSVTGYILHSTSSWPLVFNIMAMINLPGLVSYLVFANSRKIQLE